MADNVPPSRPAGAQPWGAGVLQPSSQPHDGLLPMGGVGGKASAAAGGGGILSLFAAAVDKENSQKEAGGEEELPDGSAAVISALQRAKASRATELHDFQANRVPAKSALRKSLAGGWGGGGGGAGGGGGGGPNEDMAKLMEKFGTLEGQMQQFSTQTQARRDSLTCRSERYQPDAGPAAAAQAGAPPQESHGQQQQQPCSARAAPLDAAVVAASQDDDGATPPGAKEYIVRLPAGAAASKFMQSAAEVFEEAGVRKLVMDGLYKQLKRTKDGATEKSRIQELAGEPSWLHGGWGAAGSGERGRGLAAPHVREPVWLESRLLVRARARGVCVHARARANLCVSCVPWHTHHWQRYIRSPCMCRGGGSKGRTDASDALHACVSH